MVMFITRSQDSYYDIFGCKIKSYSKIITFNKYNVHLQSYVWTI